MSINKNRNPGYWNNSASIRTQPRTQPQSKLNSNFTTFRSNLKFVNGEPETIASSEIQSSIARIVRPQFQKNVFSEEIKFEGNFKIGDFKKTVKIKPCNKPKVPTVYDQESNTKQTLQVGQVFSEQEEDSMESIHSDEQIPMNDSAIGLQIQLDMGKHSRRFFSRNTSRDHDEDSLKNYEISPERVNTRSAQHMSIGQSKIKSVDVDNTRQVNKRSLEMVPLTTYSQRSRTINQNNQKDRNCEQAYLELSQSSITEMGEEDQRSPIGSNNQMLIDPMQTCLKHHILAYRSSIKKHKTMDNMEKIDKIQEITSYLINNKIKCFKYNYSLEDIVQNFTSFQGYIKLSQDGEYLQIVNLKPEEKLKYVLEADPNIVEEEKKKYQKTEEDANHIPSEFEEEDDQVLLKEDLSSASCKISEIKNFIFGGFSSRFWMLRKHIITTEQEQLKNIPFYSWNCITLQLEHRDVDLVIKSEKQMQIFVEFLVFKLKTLDGRRNTSLNLLKILNEKDIKQFKKKNRKQEISGARELQIMQKNEMQLLTKVCTKYSIMKIRNKISYMAFEKGVTISELWLKSILKSHQEFQSCGLSNYDPESEKMYDAILKHISDQDISFIKILVLEKVKVKKKLITELNLEKSPMNDDQEETGDGGITPVEKTIKKNKMKNEFFEDQFVRILKNDKCSDIFKNVSTSKQNYDVISYKNFLNHKFDVKRYNMTLNRLKLLINMRLAGGSMFIKLVLLRIEYNKLLFMSDIEIGKNTFVCKDISQSQYPLSYRYYDPILTMIQKRIKNSKKEMVGVEKSVALRFHNQAKDRSLRTFLGFGNQQEKLVFQHSIVNKKQRKEIDHHQSPYTMDLQRSRYICIDKDILDQQKFEKLQRMGQQAKGSTAKDNSAINNQMIINTLNINFCLPKVVNDNQNQFLIFKSTFYAKQAHLKLNGQKLETMKLLEAWLVENVDVISSKLQHYFFSCLEPDQKLALQMHKKYGQKTYDNFKKDLFIKVMLQKVEEMIIKRRQKIRQKQLKNIKKIIHPSNDFVEKSQGVDRLIETDYNIYFGNQNSAASKNFNRLFIQLKQTEDSLRRIAKYGKNPKKQNN